MLAIQTQAASAAETSATDSPAAPAGSSRLPLAMKWRSALSAWRALGRIHGAWTPGVRLMRNLSMRAKALTLMAALGAVAASLAHDFLTSRAAQHRLMADAEAAIAPYSARFDLKRLIDVPRVPLLSGQASPGTLDFGALIQTEQAAHDRLQEAIAPVAADDEQLTTVLQRVALRRDFARSQWAAAGRLGATAHVDAIDEYWDELHLVGLQLLQASGLAHYPDEGVRAVYHAGLTSIPVVATTLERQARLQWTLPQTDFVSTQLALELQRTALRAAVLMEQAAPHLDRAVALGLLDGTSVARDRLVIQEYLQRVLEVTSAALTSPEAAGDFALPAGSVRQLAALAQRAGEAGRNVQAQSIQSLRERLQASHSAADREQAYGIGVKLALLLLAGYLLVCGYKVLAGGINVLCHHVRQLAQGNLGIRPVGYGRDEIGVALNELSDAASRLTLLFETVTDGVGAVGQASREVATGNGGLSGRTQEIRMSMGTVSERAQAFSELMSRCSAEVEQAVQEVRAMQTEARHGRRSMGHLRERMGTLKVKSREITQMVRMMDAVAFQTRLLALNASVEAARSGAEGKGFAVVAQEVRALAQRNAEAARRIDDIVSSSLAEIEECNLLTERAVEAVAQTDLKIDSVHDSMGAIVSMTREGMTASHDVAGEARRVAASIEGNARLVEQLSHASADLRRQGESLRGSVAQFVLR